MTQEFNRKFSRTNSRITKTAEQIRLEVSNEIRGLSSSIEIQLDGITQRVEDNEARLSQTLRVAADGVTITNSQGSTLTIDGGQIDASKINTEQLDASRIHAEELNLSGKITFGDLAPDAQGSITNAQSTANSALNQASAARGNIDGYERRNSFRSWRRKAMDTPNPRRDLCWQDRYIIGAYLKRIDLCNI
jgi:hypothetical protein